MKTLRLLMFEECQRKCEGCCNNDWDLSKLPIVESYQNFDMIVLTGGEPMLAPRFLVETCAAIRKETEAPIILYTAKSKRVVDLLAVLHWVDGVTLTLHEQYDVFGFLAFNKLYQILPYRKSMRLNVFSNVDLSGVNTDGWDVHAGMKWIKNCPLPENEVFMRLNAPGGYYDSR